MSEIDEVRELLPWWVVWGPLLITVPAVFLLTLLAGRVAGAVALSPLRRGRPTDWVEQARLGFPGKWVAYKALLLAPFLWVVAAYSGFGPLCPVPRPLLVVLVGAAACVAVGITARRVLAEARGQRLSWARWLRELLVSWFVFSGHLFVLVLVLTWMPERFGPLAWILLALGGVGVAFFAAGGGALLARAAGLFRPAGERLRSVVERASERSGVRPAAVYETDLVQANAFAFPVIRRVVFTTALVQAMDDEELEAVCVHELAHLSESRTILAARMLPALALLPLVAYLPVFHALGVLAVPFLVLPGAAAVLFSNRLSRKMEKRADVLALGDESAGTYARALLQLAQTNVSPLVASGSGASHPHTYDRLVAVGMRPDFPRPSPPPDWHWQVGLLVYGTLPLVLAFAGVVAVPMTPPNEPVVLAVLAVQGGAEAPISNLGVLRVREDRWDESAKLFRASVAIAPRSIHAPTSLAMALAHLDRCDEAEAALREAERRSQDRAKVQENEQMIEQARQAVKWCRAKREDVPRWP